MARRGNGWHVNSVTLVHRYLWRDFSRFRAKNNQVIVLAAKVNYHPHAFL